MLTELALQKLLDGAFGIGCDLLAKKFEEATQSRSTQTNKANNSLAPKFDLNTQRTADALRQHFKTTKKWCSSVGFLGAPHTKHVDKIYVQLDAYVVPRRQHVSWVEANRKTTIATAVKSSYSHLAVLGLPGAGKTTSMKKICAEFFSNKRPALNQAFPIVIRFRDHEVLDESSPIIGTVARLLRLQVLWDKSQTELPKQLSRIIQDIERDAIVGFLETLSPLVILDGFDELPSELTRDRAIAELRVLCERCRSARFILTSRTGEFHVNIDGLHAYELAPLTESQVLTFATQWLGASPAAEDFCSRVMNTPFADTRFSPLLLAHLCAIFERTGAIPEKPKTIYRKVVHLLLEEWDQQWSLRRPSKYANFEPDRKFEFLCYMAYQLLESFGKYLFTVEHLQRVYSDISKNFHLPRNESQKVVDELEGQTGLFLQSGFERYEFAHKSLHEFLAAEFLVHLPSIVDASDFLRRFPNEAAVATAIAFDSTRYFNELALNCFGSSRVAAEYINTYLTRLLQEAPDLYPNEQGAVVLLALSSYGARNEAIASIAPLVINDAAVHYLKDHYRCGELSPTLAVLHRRHANVEIRAPESMAISTRLLKSIAGTTAWP